MSRKQRRIAQQQNQQQSRPSTGPSASNPGPQQAGGGPRTPAGKAVSSQNAFSHGLTAARLVLPWEDEDEFTALLDQLVAEHQPATATEALMVREMAEQYWRLQRARNHEHSLLLQTPKMIETVDSNPALFQAWDKEVTLAQRYATRHERAFHKCLTTLRTLQKERRLAQSEAEAETESQRDTAPVSNPNEFVSQNPNVTHLNPKTGSPVVPPVAAPPANALENPILMAASQVA